MKNSTARTLRALLAPWVDVSATQDRPILGLTQDSRAVQPGFLFLAAPGARHDGRAYIQDAVRRGAAAVLFERERAAVESKEITVPAFGWSALRRDIGLIADRFYGSPSQRLAVIGVTGTNGKTTCTQLLAQALDTTRGRCGLIGTLGAGFPGALKAGDYTTPDAVQVHRLLAEFAAAGAAYVSMEVSSHALEQGRVAGVAFRGAVFTNLTRDHLDYHGDMAAYGAAKARLFAIPDLQFAVINTDDAFGRELLKQLSPQKLRVSSFGFDQGDVRAEVIRALPDGLELEVATAAGRVQFKSSLLGRFNAANLLAVLASLLALGIGLDEAAARLSRVQPVTGRMQRFGGRAAPLVVVDYAHTPDALEKVLVALRAHTAGRLWCVFGCGGDRDRGKRPLMGRLAEQLADRVVVTSDNPRHEPPEGIIEEILAGMRAAPDAVRTILDREQAIRSALAEAQPGDVVLVAGKGHEDYQQLGDRRLPFSDAGLVSHLLGDAA